MRNPRLIVGISGSSGIIYGIRLLEALKTLPIESHLIVSKAGKLTLSHESSLSLNELTSLADVYHQANNLAASIASGSCKTIGMIVAPCSMKTLAEIANGNSSNLLTRAADVVLKERRRLVLMARESPLNLVHLQNMMTVTQMGGIISPPVPAFYNNPQSIDHLIKDSIGRVLDLFDLDSPWVRRWEG